MTAVHPSSSTENTAKGWGSNNHNQKVKNRRPQGTEGERMVRCRRRQSAARRAATSPRRLTLDRCCRVSAAHASPCLGTSSNRRANHHNCPENPPRRATPRAQQTGHRRTTRHIAFSRATDARRRPRHATPRCPPPRRAARERLCCAVSISIRRASRSTGHPPTPERVNCGK